MSPTSPLQIPPAGDLDFLALGALIHRLDPGVVPFHKAQSFSVHVSGGETPKLAIVPADTEPVICTSGDDTVCIV